MILAILAKVKNKWHFESKCRLRLRNKEHTFQSIQDFHTIQEYTFSTIFTQFASITIAAFFFSFSNK